MPFPDRFDPVTEESQRVLSLSIPRDELEEVVTWGQRFAAQPFTPAVLLCIASVGRRRWVCTEANVEAWMDFQDIDQRDNGMACIPHHVLESALLASHRDEPTTIEIDPGTNRLFLRSLSFSFGCDMPPLPERVPVLDFPVGRNLVLSGALVEAAAQVLRVPSGTFDNDQEVPWPYVTLSVHDRVVRLARDWGEFGGGMVEAFVESIGIANIFDGTAAFYSDVVLRELWIRADSDSEVVRFSFYSESPDIMVVTCENWGMKVALGSEFVLRYRRLIEGKLVEAGFEVEQDDRRDWSPVVRAEVQGRSVTVELLRAERIQQSHVRVAGLVAEGLSWSTELGAELNSWNDAWSTCKLLFREGTLLVVRDLPVGSLEHLTAAVEDLVQRTMVVHDVVGPLM